MPRRQLSPAATVVFILLVPLVVSALFLLLGPSADRARAQELGPKQAFVPPSRTSEGSTNSGSATRRAANARARAKDSATATPQKPSEKMEFYTDSATPRTNRLPTPSRSAADTLVRRQAQNQSAKIAATRRSPQEAPRVEAPSISAPPAPVPEPAAKAIVERISEPAPTQVAKTDEEQEEWGAPRRELVEVEPEAVVRSQPEPPAQFSERPEPLLPDFEMPLIRAPQRPKKMLEEEVVVEEESTPASPSRDVVQLYFEEETPAEDDANESLDLVEREPDEVMEFVEPAKPLEKLLETPIEPAPTSEIQNVAAQEKPDDGKPTNTAVAQTEEVPALSGEILAELKPIRSIEIRKAVEVPPLSEMDNPQLREPADQAGAMLRKRPPFKFWPVYRDPWTANRDSFAFHHYPLWFEDPNLERCGRGKGHFTSVASFLQFNANIAFLPYRMTAEPWHSCVRTLPDCTVCQKFGCDAYLPPWSWRAAAVQAGCIVGFIYAIP